MGVGLRARLITGGLLGLAAVVAIAAPPRSRQPTARDGRTTLPFRGRGVQGPIDGVVTVEADRIVDVTVTHSDEGVDRRALAPDRIGDRFRGRPARPPLAVDAISGATISTERLIEAVEQRLARWREAEHVR
ncbi:MAG: FMN-binding protein [Kofleriaceae bacterium]|nr:FMN-binding protein [Kofleriaceae bacterium]